MYYTKVYLESVSIFLVTEKVYICNYMKFNIKYTYLFLILFIYTNLYSQNIDSLKSNIKNLNTKSIISSCNQLSDYYFYSQPDSAEKYLNIGLKTSISNQLKKDEAIFFQKKGVLANEQGDILTAKKFFNKMIEIAKSISDTSLIISATGNLGNSYMYAGEYEKAIEKFTEVANFAELKNDIRVLANANGAIGNLYYHLKRFEKALSYYQKSKLNFEEINNEIGIALSYMNIAVVYYNTERYEDALENYSYALEIFTKNNNMLNSAKCLSGIARIYSFQGFNKKAIDEEKKAYAIYLDYEANIDIVNSLYFIAFNEILLKKYKSAIEKLDSAYNIAVKNNYYSKLEKITDNYRVVFDSLSNYEKAYKYLLLNKMYHDSVFNKESSDRFSELEVKYETSQKEQEIKLLKKDSEIQENKSRNRQLLLFGIISLLILLIFIFYLIYNRYKLKSTKKTIEVEQKLLRTQMNPHFIFNALFAIENFMRKNDIEQSSQYISNFSKLMRLILESSRKEYISLDEEIEILEYYIEFQQLRFNNKFTYKITCSENIDKENTLIPPMLIQPFIENAIEHGFTKEIENPHLDISFSLKVDRIFIKVEDNGKGIDNLISEKENHQSLAIQITEERLSMLKRNKKKSINLKISNLANTNPELKGTRVSFNIPHIEEF